jgi:hypothetical protein
VGASTDGLLGEDRRCVEAPGEEIKVGGACLGRGGVAGLEPFIWDLVQNFGKNGRIEACGGEGGGLFQTIGPRQEYVISDVGEGRAGETVGVGPVVVKVQGCAVVDEVELAMPVEEIGVACRAIDVQGEGVEPYGERGDARIGFVVCGGVEHGGAGKIVEGEVEADTGAEEIADLLIGFVSSEGGVYLSEDQFGDVEVEGATDFAGYEFGYKGERALTGTTEFDYVETEVVGLNDCGKRAAFAESGDVLGRADGAKHCCLV